MAKENNNVKILVDTDVVVMINGQEIKVKKGVQNVDKEIARILIEAGYAKYIEEK